MTEKSFLISSFILRFVKSDENGNTSFFRGSIRHIQAEEEINFTDWDEVKEFVSRYVPIDE